MSHRQGNPSQPGETAVENINNVLQLLSGEESLHLDEAEIVSAARDRLTAALQDLQKNPQRRRNGKGNPLGAMLTIVNPEGAIEVGPVTGKDRGRLMAKGVHSIAYRHADNGHDYEHEFEQWDRVRIKVLNDYCALLFSEQVPIIQMFEVED